eukprot:scaffold10578_cov158-Skeletonema_menzelii.AAC.1
MNHLALLFSATTSLLWAAVVLSCCCDALSITHVVSSRGTALLKSSSSPPHHHRLKTSSSLKLSSLDQYDDESSAGKADHEDKLLPRVESYAPRNLHMKYPLAASDDINVNNLFGWKNEIVQNFLLKEQQRTKNFNKAICATAMSVVIGMQPLSSAVATDSNNISIMSDNGFNYPQGPLITTIATTSSNNNLVKSSSSILASSSELRVKIDDTINSKKSSSSESNSNKVSMGVKIEYYPEEIEMKLQAEREVLEEKKKKAQLLEREEQEKIDVEREQQLLLLAKKAQEETKMMEEKLVQEKEAAAAAAALAASSVATAPLTGKVVEQSMQQQPSLVPST